MNNNYQIVSPSFKVHESTEFDENRRSDISIIERLPLKAPDETDERSPVSTFESKHESSVPTIEPEAQSYSDFPIISVEIDYCDSEISEIIVLDQLKEWQKHSRDEQLKESENEGMPTEWMLGVNASTHHENRRPESPLRKNRFWIPLAYTILGGIVGLAIAIACGLSFGEEETKEHQKIRRFENEKLGEISKNPGAGFNGFARENSLEKSLPSIVVPNRKERFSHKKMAVNSKNVQKRKNAVAAAKKNRSNRGLVGRRASVSSKIQKSPAQLSTTKKVIKPGYMTVDARPYAKIYVDKKEIGDTPIIKLKVSAGKHIVWAKCPDGQQQRLVVNVPSNSTVRRRLTRGRP